MSHLQIQVREVTSTIPEIEIVIINLPDIEEEEDIIIADEEESFDEVPDLEQDPSSESESEIDEDRESISPSSEPESEIEENRESISEFDSNIEEICVYNGNGEIISQH